MAVLAPPIAFVIVLAVTLAGFAGAALLPPRRKGNRGALAKPYASGETMERSRFQPDYGEFFPFAWQMKQTGALPSFVVSCRYVSVGSHEVGCGADPP